MWPSSDERSKSLYIETEINFISPNLYVVLIKRFVIIFHKADI